MASDMNFHMIPSNAYWQFTTAAFYLEQRVLHEVLTNILKHAEAETARIRSPKVKLCSRWPSHHIEKRSWETPTPLYRLRIAICFL
jgi:hypothetical protein